MFIVSISYKVSLDKVDRLLNEHVTYLKKEYENGSFILSGRKKPRTGGVIISNLKSRSELNDIIDRDPFKRENLANYDIIEIMPNMSSKELEFILD